MFRRVRIAGESMMPTLSDGETLLVDTRAYLRVAPKAGDIVLAWHPDGSRKIVKRVVAGPPQADLATTVYVRGDNPAATTDSDHFGPLPRALLLGKVWFSTTRWRRVR